MLVDECLKRIELYRMQKENNMFDTFYHSHLDLMEKLLEDEKDKKNRVFKLIIEPSGNLFDSGVVTPNYVTICKSPHWNGNEGVMLTCGTYDATKFDYDEKDLDDILKFVRGRFPGRKFEVVDISKTVFGNTPREVWSSNYVKCDFDETGMIGGEVVVDKR